MSAPNAAKLKSFAVTLALIGAAIALAGLAYLYLTPKMYRASVRIAVGDWNYEEDRSRPIDPTRLLTECELLRTKAVETNSGLGETPAQIKQAMLVRAIPNSSVMEITATSKNREETSRLANGLARLYLDYRREQRMELIAAKVAGLQQKWDEQSKKIREAQDAVDNLYFENLKERSTNRTQLYDTEAYGALVNERVKLEGESVAKHSQLDQLEKLKPDDLVEVLSSMDENSPLMPPVLELTKSKSALFKANSEHGADSQEVKEATLLVDKLNKEISGLAVSNITQKQNELYDLSLKLEALKIKIQNGSTNIAAATIRYSNYQEALTNLNMLKQERDDLQNKILAVESAEASRPTGMIAQLLGAAETPDKPFSPDGKLAAGMLVTGGCVIFAGIIVFIASQRPLRAPEKRPA